MVEFAKAFRAVTGHSPFRWQERLYRRLVSGDIPPVCDLPTGLGKTSIIPIWLIALGTSVERERGNGRLPRRLVYIVNRRTVVDQATNVVVELRRRLLDPENSELGAHTEVLRSLVESLRKLGANDEVPLAVSTLRGELADNREWKINPARPAIVIGTVDMIGSKLLFSGYGDSRYHRPHHAGLIGQDTLIVHDEAHLSPAFDRLLHTVQTEQRKCNEMRQIRVMGLSATSRDGDPDAAGTTFGLSDDDREDIPVHERLSAVKRLRVVEVEKAAVVGGIVDEGIRLGKTHCRLLIYVQSPDTAKKVADGLRKKLERADQGHVGILTGTIRGYERDLLAESELVKAFKPNAGREPPRHTWYLVSTSAGEVGADWDADHLVCDRSTLDSMAQRFGRVNRLGGEGRQAEIIVVWEKPADEGKKEGRVKKSDPLEGARAKTLEALRSLPLFDGSQDVYDASPAALAESLTGNEAKYKEKARGAFSPPPTILPATDILFDNWSLTSIKGELPGRPEVEPYLHGVADWEPPETYVVWRKEVALLDTAGVDDATLSDWFDACRIEARERLRDRTDRVKEQLGELLAGHRKKKQNSDIAVIVLDERGNSQWSKLSSVVGKEFNLAFRTIVLPVEAGGLNEAGMLDAHSDADATDVAEGGQDGRQRWLLTKGTDRASYERLETGEPADSLPPDLREVERITLAEPLEDAEDEGESRYLLLTVPRKQSAPENPETARIEQTLDDHTSRIVEHIRHIADALGLDGSLKDALILAAERHDLGKDRPVWQRYACNPDSDRPLAKSTKYLPGRRLGGYRHEFGSVLQARDDPRIKDHPERDLILHLIAAHHAWARPHFEARAFDHQGPEDASGERHPPRTTENRAAAIEVMQRFGRLQQRFGRWGLAWLESLLRSADIAASVAPSQCHNEGQSP